MEQIRVGAGDWGPARCLALTLSLLAVGVALGAAAEDRDWSACPAIVEVDTAADVYALGDVHGDSERLVAMLSANGLLAAPPERPESAEWAGGPAVLVLTGDLIGKWNRALDVLDFVRALATSAATAGGRVLVTTGNHEAELLANPDGRKAKIFRKELKARDLDPDDVAAGRDAAGIGAYLRCLPFAAKVNDAFFSHAGSTDGRSLAELTDAIETGFENDGYDTKVLAGKKGLLEARMKPPWWEKDKDRDDPAKSEKRLRRYAEALGVDHIVFGHQPGKYTFSDGTKRKKGEALAKFDGLVVLLDVGMSRGVDASGDGYSTGALLRIRRTAGEETGTVLDSEGEETPLWATNLSSPPIP